jgi:hypothetical protein
MKGIKEIELDGKKIKLRFTLGVLEDFQEYCEKNDLDVDEALQKMKHMREFISLMTEYAGDKVESEKFKFLDFYQMQDAIAIIGEATGSLGNPKAGAKK